jgi:hypothetical protein
MVTWRIHGNPFHDPMEWKSMESSMTPVEWNGTDVYENRNTLRSYNVAITVAALYERGRD